MNARKRRFKNSNEIGIAVFNGEFFSKLAYQLRFLLETSRCAIVANALRYEIAFSAIQKLKLFSLLKIKEGLKQATKIELLILMRVFFENIKNTRKGAGKKAKSL